MTSNYLIVGTGLIGLQIIEELFSKGINPSEITSIDPHSFPIGNDLTNNPKSRDVQKIVNRNQSNKGMSKKALSLEELSSMVMSQTYFWGASCLPPMRFEVPGSEYDPETIKESYAKVTKSIGVQGAHSHKAEEINFPFTQEIMNELPRKQLAQKWVNSSEGEIYHTRLAISMAPENACTFHGNCFEGCPKNSIWNPANHRTHFQNEFSKMKRISDTVTAVNSKERVVSTAKGHEYKYDKLIITAGPQASVRLAKTMYPGSNFELLSSPVLLMPFLVRERSTVSDYKSHFVLADLLVPFMDENGLATMTQIYLPTTEISGRILLQLPRFVNEIALHLPGKNLEYIMRHVGVAMIFGPGHASNISVAKVKGIMKEPIIHLRKVLAKNGANLLHGPRHYILNHLSHHSGAIYNQNDGVRNTGINSRLYQHMRGLDISILDSCLLSDIPPGPHTLTAASLARLEVKKND